MTSVTLSAGHSSLGPCVGWWASETSEITIVSRGGYPSPPFLDTATHIDVFKEHEIVWRAA